MDFLIAPRKVAFAASQWAEFREVCREDAAATRVKRIESVADVLLIPSQGVTASGRFRYNRDAFRQITSLVAGPLYAAMAAAVDASTLDTAELNKHLIKAFNNLCVAGESQLLRQRLVIDARSGEVLGVHGGRYQRVSNSSLIEIANSFVVRKKSPFRLIRGEIRNRNLTAVFSLPSSRKAIGDRSWMEGTAVYNSETTSRAVAVPRALLDSGSRSYSLEVEDMSNRLTHVKRKGFLQLLDTVVVDGFSRESWLPALSPRLRQLCDRQVSPQNIPRFAEYCKASLDKQGIGQQLTERIVDAIKQRGERGLKAIEFYTQLLRVADDVVGASRLLRNAAFKVVAGDPGES